MGSEASKLKRKSQHMAECSTSRLVFQERSDEIWAFGGAHLDAINLAIENLSLHGVTFVTDIIGTFLQFYGAPWNHQNYTSFVHQNANEELLRMKSLKWDKKQQFETIMVGKLGVGKTYLGVRKASELSFSDVPNDHMGRKVRIYFMSLMYMSLMVKIGPHFFLPIQYYYKDIQLAKKRKIKLWMYDTCFTYYSKEAIDFWGAARASNVKVWLLVFDVFDPESFWEIEEWRKEIVEETFTKSTKSTMIAVGTKCDLRVDGNFELMQNAVDLNEVIQWCKKNDIAYVETSAKNGKNIDYLFKQCVYEYLLKEKAAYAIR